jgi:hypothetical protein
MVLRQGKNYVLCLDPSKKQTLHPVVQRRIAQKPENATDWWPKLEKKHDKTYFVLRQNIYGDWALGSFFWQNRERCSDLAGGPVPPSFPFVIILERGDDWMYRYYTPNIHVPYICKRYQNHTLESYLLTGPWRMHLYKGSISRWMQLVWKVWGVPGFDSRRVTVVWLLVCTGYELEMMCLIEHSRKCPSVFLIC